MMPASKHGDPQLGIDIHPCVVPPSPSPVPLPTPHMSIVFDPFDYLPFVGTSITVCGMKRANAGTNGMSVHIPPGFPFAPKLPDKDDELFMGSMTVTADGDPFSFIAVPVLSCQLVGMPGIPRIKKKGPPKLMLLPTTFNLAIPTNVFIGGPPTISLMGMLGKLGFAALGKFAKSGLFKRMRQKMFGNLKPGFLKCKVLRAEPVNILSGEVSVEQLDFTLAGRIPIEWTRSYTSGKRRAGVCGHGWETIVDARLEVDPWSGVVSMHHPAAGPLYFARLPKAPGDAGAELEMVDGALLSDAGAEYRVRTKEDRSYAFPKRLFSTRSDGTQEFALESLSDLCGNSLSLERRGGLPVAIRESAGRRIELVYEHGRIAELRMHIANEQPPHVFVRYEYDAAGDLIAAIDALGHPYRFGYDEHHLVRHTNRTGLSFYYEYDKEAPGDWRVVHSWGDGGLYDYCFAYDDLLRERRITDSLGHVSLVKLDERGLPISEIDPLGGVTIYEYDAVGRSIALIDPSGHRTEWEYDERGNLIRLSRPDGKCAEIEFGASGKACRIIGPDGAEWTQDWNEKGLLTRQTSPLGHMYRFEFSAQGNVTAVIDPRQARTEFIHDSVGNLTVLRDAMGHETRFSYDPLGNLISKTDALQQRISYEYDARGQWTAVILTSGATVRGRRDAEGRLLEYIDERGHATRFEHCGQGQVSRRIQADGHAVEYRYDTEERLTAILNQRGETYRFVRDPLGRIVEEVDYWGQKTAFGYTACGYIAEKVDPLGRAIRFETDALGRIVKSIGRIDGETVPALEETFEYDSSGRLTVAANAHLRVERRFDPEGRLLEEKQGHDFAITNAYDEVGNRIRRETIFERGSSSVRRTLLWSYDLLNRPNEVSIEGRAPIRIEHDARGRIVHERLSESVRKELRYGAEGLLERQRVMHGERAVAEVTYAYDACGNLTERSDRDFGADQYAYDPIGRLVEHLDPRRQLKRYWPDAAGDLLVSEMVGRVMEPIAGQTPETPPEDAWRREGQCEGARFRFDRAGNLIQRVNGHQTLALEWDSRQRLVAADANGTHFQYRYDALGRRSEKSGDRERQLFRWDGDHLLLEQMSTLSDRHSPSPPSEEVQSRRSERIRSLVEWIYYPGSFEPLACMTSASEEARPERATLTFYQNDPNGLPQRLISMDGKVVWAGRFSALGKLEGGPALGTAHQPLRLQGQYADEETELHYNRHRYFDPSLGSYISPDPMRTFGGLNLYALGLNVWRWIDPFGLSCDDILFGQKRIAPQFRSMDADIPDYLRGRALRDVAEDLKTGKLHPDQLEVKYFVHPETGQKIAESNRTLAALSMADMKPTRVREVPVTQELLNRLDDPPPLRHHGEVFSMPGRSIPVTPGPNNLQVIDVARLP